MVIVTIKCYKSFEGKYMWFYNVHCTIVDFLYIYYITNMHNIVFLFIIFTQYKYFKI